jgi:hypothetical protein
VNTVLASGWTDAWTNDVRTAVVARGMTASRTEPAVRAPPLDGDRNACVALERARRDALLVPRQEEDPKEPDAERDAVPWKTVPAATEPW